VPRFFAYHVVWAPLALAGLIAGHLVIVLKQKHTEMRRAGAPPEAAEGAYIHGIPLWPEQVALMGVLFLVMLGVLAALAAFLRCTLRLLRAAAAGDAGGEARLVPAVGIRRAAPHSRGSASSCSARRSARRSSARCSCPGFSPW